VSWPQKRAATELYRLAKRERNAGRPIEAGALCYALLVDQAWSARALFELALREHLNLPRDEATELAGHLATLADVDADSCDHCGLALLPIPDVLIPYRIAAEPNA